jgi:hypothetical protein
MIAMPSRITGPVAVAALLLAGIGGVAAAVAASWAGGARERLGFRFAGLEPTVGTAGSILAGNVRLLAALLLAALLAQARPAATAGDVVSALSVLGRAACDTLVALTVALNVLVVGAALGAYGARMVAAILPHGPLELAAYAPALSLYLRAHLCRVPRRTVIATGAWGALALTLAAALETFVAV